MMMMKIMRELREFLYRQFNEIIAGLVCCLRKKQNNFTKAHMSTSSQITHEQHENEIQTSQLCLILHKSRALLCVALTDIILLLEQIILYIFLEETPAHFIQQWQNS